jgi:hypothetical protein
MTSKYKTFKDYYDSDPEFRKKHLERSNEKVICECGFVSARSNLARHKKSHLHINKMKKINRINELKKELKKLEET